MISHKHKCIFIHIPKCAGTSIESALGHLENHKGRNGQDHRSLRMIERPILTINTLKSRGNIVEALRGIKHQHIDKTHNCRNKYRVSKQQFNSYYKFTVVRNPWARAFSWYKNVIRDEKHLEKRGLAADVSFNEFLSDHAGKDMLKPQLHWIKNFSGSIQFDHIARFENLTEDISHIFKQLRIKNCELPHEIKGTKSDFREHYDSETNDIIKSVYRDEIEIFGYSFDS